MLNLNIPGLEPLHIKHLLLDCNGTLTCDGKLLDGVATRLQALARNLHVEIITADTHGNAAATLGPLGCTLHIIGASQQAEAKRDHLSALGCDNCVAIGNGFNDSLMLQQAAIGIAVIQAEGAAGAAVANADVVCTSICAALDLLLEPKRIQATLRR